MKKIFKYIFAGMAAMSVVACSEDALETSPSSSVSGNELLGTATNALVSLNGVYRAMYTAGVSNSSNTHQCFGITAYNLVADVMGEDCIMNGQGSGWFWYELGQAYAVRAYSYFMLAQMFSRTYKGHESEPCVPLYTEPTDIATEGKGRATVEEVYQQITSDLDKAITMLGNSGKRKHISHINEAVASGIKARVALVMEDWQTALDAANAAISKSGCSIGTGTAVTGGMNDATANNVMWAAEIIADQSGMYAGFFTHMDADQGKYGASARKQINKLLYAKLGTNDVRKKWWNPQDENNEKNGYQQEKFKFKDYAKWTGDYIFMRIEEMFLTAAEASCRLNDDKGARLMLNSLMQERDEDYTCKKTGTALGKLTSDETGSLLEEIIIKRRIELWG